ncbi:hypothetical protein [Rhodococcus jostii]|uniref:hypothetical protein n=1 Tax=Rhodococcus jostii TaxID=132919 RepID=UPI00362A9D32
MTTMMSLPLNALRLGYRFARLPLRLVEDVTASDQVKLLSYRCDRLAAHLLRDAEPAVRGRRFLDADPAARLPRPTAPPQKSLVNRTHGLPTPTTNVRTLSTADEK